MILRGVSLYNDATVYSLLVVRKSFFCPQP